MQSSSAVERLEGIGVIGAFTATVASWFMEQQSAGQQSIDARLERIEAQLGELLSRRRDGDA
jgi:hypothetical protein